MAKRKGIKRPTQHFTKNWAIQTSLRDRPFNLKGGGGVMVFCFVQIFFFGQHKS